MLSANVNLYVNHAQSARAGEHSNLPDRVGLVRQEHVEICAPRQDMPTLIDGLGNNSRGGGGNGQRG